MTLDARRGWGVPTVTRVGQTVVAAGLSLRLRPSVSRTWPRATTTEILPFAVRLAEDRSRLSESFAQACARACCSPPR